MPRVLTCLDPTPAADPSVCVNQAWIEQASIRDFLPTVDQANEVGAVAFSSLIVLAIARKLLFPPETKELT